MLSKFLLIKITHKFNIFMQIKGVEVERARENHGSVIYSLDNGTCQPWAHTGPINPKNIEPTQFDGGYS